MSVQRYVIDGFGQLEINNGAFRRDGRIEAQCALNATDFASIPAENGMLLAVNKAANTIDLPKGAKDCPIAINYSAEHMYDERTPGLKNFNLKLGEFLPRMGYLSIGDKFTTNCFSYDTDDFANDAAVEELDPADGVYASEYVNGDGSILLGEPAEGAQVILKVIEKTTMPDGQFALKFQVVPAVAE